ncbi:hypothetical protein DL98DRAFT_87906 [Cadophora sp. DSE1049]|nr:hypothetical protein DL98DRAFT_87906 [Cadophora sp. DSE1049]
MQTVKQPNHAINHIAISCVDLEGLVSWYSRHLGFELIGEIRHFNRRDHPGVFATIFVSYPEEMRELKFAVLTSGNGVGIEVFQFIDPKPKVREDPFDFARVGVFHICVTDPDPVSLLAKIERDGGKRVGGWMDYSRYGLAGHRGLYMQDPWGNVIEVMSLSIERVSSAGAAVSWAQEQMKKVEDTESSSQL